MINIPIIVKITFTRFVFFEYFLIVRSEKMRIAVAVTVRTRIITTDTQLTILKIFIVLIRLDFKYH